jgi:hypothetical protein
LFQKAPVFAGKADGFPLCICRRLQRPGSRLAEK